MAAPLSGITGTQQQIPAAQALQPAAADQTRNVRQTEQSPEQNEIQPRDAAAGQSQQSNTAEEQTFRQAIAEFTSSDQETAPPRGSVLDTTV